MVVTIVTIPDILIVEIRPALTLFVLLAPIFCPTKVERAWEKDIAGTIAIESNRRATEISAFLHFRL